LLLPNGCILNFKPIINTNPQKMKNSGNYLIRTFNNADIKYEIDNFDTLKSYIYNPVDINVIEKL